MGLLSRMFARVPQSEVAQRARRLWAQVAAPDLDGSLAGLRCVVIDTETAGLDPYQDALIAVGACRIEAGAVSVGDAFEVLLQQRAPSATGNILVHGIGQAAQAAGCAPDAAMLAYLEFVRRHPAAGFHTRFDLVALERAIRRHLGIDYRPHYLDAALILPELFGMAHAAQWTLDQWSAHFGLQAFARHGALSDAFVTAQLCMLCFARAEATGHDGLAPLLQLQRRVLEQRSRHA